MKDLAQDVVEDVPPDVAQDLTFRRARAPFSPRHHHRRRRLCAACAEMGAQLFRAVGKRFRRCRAESLYVHK